MEYFNITLTCKTGQNKRTALQVRELLESIDQLFFINSKESTDLLLNFEGNNGDKTTTDATSKKHDVEFYGNAKISTDQAQFGSSSLYLDGDRDYLEVDYSYHFQLESEDFTVEWWEYREA